MGEACRACDGRGERTVTDKDNVFSTKTRVCGVCQGGRRVVQAKPSTGRRFFPRKDKDDDQDGAGDAFLRARGYDRNGAR